VPGGALTPPRRVGRTARAGRSGRSVTIVTQYDVEMFQKIEHLTGVKMEQFPAEREEVLLLLEQVGAEGLGGAGRGLAWGVAGLRRSRWLPLARVAGRARARAWPRRRRGLLYTPPPRPVPLAPPRTPGRLCAAHRDNADEGGGRREEGQEARRRGDRGRGAPRLPGHGRRRGRRQEGPAVDLVAPRGPPACRRPPFVLSSVRALPFCPHPPRCPRPQRCNTCSSPPLARPQRETPSPPPAPCPSPRRPCARRGAE
jgi:hypothetical protein